MSKIVMTTSKDLTVEQSISEFIIHSKAKNLAEKSIISYEDKLKKFKNFIGEQTEISSINKKTIEEFTIKLQNEQLSDSTIATYLRAVRAWLYYCMKENYLGEFKVHISKEADKLPKCYTDEEIKKLLVKPITNNFNEYKIWVMENYLLATGNRLSTALEIKIKDIDFVNGYIVLRQTKNRQQQIIPMSSKLQSILMKYLTIRKGEDEDYLFCNSYGEKANQRVIQNMISNYNKKRGVERTSCHSFRHTFARKYLLNGGDAFRLQKLLGHKDLTITQKYVAIFSDDLKKDFDRLCPLN